MIYHRTMLQEGIKECFTGELHSDIRIVANDGGDYIFPHTFYRVFYKKKVQKNENNSWLFWILGVATVHQLVIAAASPLVRKAISNMDPAARMEDKLTRKFS